MQGAVLLVTNIMLLAGKGLVDEKILFIVAHRVADIHCLHCPTVTLELHIE